MFARRRREMPGLNTTSTADISFMLLIFFLVTSSMDSDWGLPRQLPTPEDHSQEQEVVVKKRNALCVKLNADGHLTCNDEAIEVGDLTKRVEDFVANAKHDPMLPEMSQREVHLLGLCQVSDRHVIMIDVHPEATYDAYFQMQHAIVEGYNNLRNQLAVLRFGHPFPACNAEQRDAINMVYPQRISEQTICQEGGVQ
jgi:biopolymer transport protein ExbD